MSQSPPRAWKDWLLMSLTAAIGTIIFFLVSQIITNTKILFVLQEQHLEMDRRLQALEFKMDGNHQSEKLPRGK